MSSIRQLAGASTFGTPSLDMHDLDDESSKGNRRRCRTTDGDDSFALHRIASLATGSLVDSPRLNTNMAGDNNITSSQSQGNTNNSSSSGFSTSLKKMRSSLTKGPFANNGASSQSDESLSSPEKNSLQRSPRRSPPRGASQRLRASTWDTAFTALKFSPLGVRKKRSISNDENIDEFPISPPLSIDAKNNNNDDEEDDSEQDIALDKREHFKLPSKFEIDRLVSSSSHSGNEEEAVAAPTPKASNLTSPMPVSENLDQTSNNNMLETSLSKNQSSKEKSVNTLALEISTNTLSTSGEEEEAKVEEGEAAITEQRRMDQKHPSVSFVNRYYDPFFDDSIERQKYFPSQIQEDRSKKSLCIERLVNPCKCLSWSLFGSYITRTAPCFWCMKTVGVSATDRQIVIRLNALIVIFCSVQIASGLFLLSIALMGYNQSTRNAAEINAYDEGDRDKPLVSQDLWSLTTFVYFLAGINALLLIAAVLAQRAIRFVNLARSVRFMWVLFWILPLQIFFSVGLFDYHRVMESWSKHWWDDKTLSWYRELFCDEGTAHGKCMVPLLGGVNYIDENAWCMAYFNATDCQSIRDAAQYEFVVTNYVYFAANGIWALVLAMIMWVTLNVLQAVITLPIVQRSKESNIPLWLTFPIIGSYMIGYVLLFSETSIDEVLDDIKWMGVTYMVSGGSFTLLALVGLALKCYTVFNTRQKRVKQSIIVLFIILIILTIFAVAVVFATSLIYSLDIVDLPLTEYREIACALDMGGSCTGCDSPIEELVCPEWTKDDVARVLQTITKQSATIAAIFLVYALATLRYGFVLFRHVSRYQIEYI